MPTWMRLLRALADARNDRQGGLCCLSPVLAAPVVIACRMFAWLSKPKRFLRTIPIVRRHLIWTNTFRSRGPSNSTNIRPCQVPNCSLLSLTGTVSLGPTMAALM